MAGELYISGIAGVNFDGGAIVDQIMQLKSIPIKKLQQEKAFIQAKLSSLANLSEGIESFLSLFENLNVEELFTYKKAEVSNSDILDATADQNAPDLSFSVTVNRLSQIEMRVSNGGFSDLGGTFASSGTLTISYDTGSGVESFNVDYSAGQTLEDLVNTINNTQSRVKASVYYDGSAYKLMLSEADAGASTVETDTAGGIFAINVSGLPSELGTDLDTLQNAQNAEIVIGSGSPITSPSNSFDNVISGITLKVKNTGSTTVTVSDDSSQIVSFLNNFVKNYNSTVELVDSITKGEGAVFKADYTIGSLKTGITDRLDPLIDLGIIDYGSETGKINLRTDKLTELLSSDPERVKEALTKLRDSYKSYLSTQKEFFGSFEKTYSDRIERIEERIGELAQRLAQEERVLRLEYARLEAFIAQANELRERLKQFIVTLSEMTKGGDK